jgi:hypothetical protein
MQRPNTNPFAAQALNPETALSGKLEVQAAPTPLMEPIDLKDVLEALRADSAWHYYLVDAL